MGAILLAMGMEPLHSGIGWFCSMLETASSEKSLCLYQQRQKEGVTRFGEIPSLTCLSALPGPVWDLLKYIYNSFNVTTYQTTVHVPTTTTFISFYL